MRSRYVGLDWGLSLSWAFGPGQPKDSGILRCGEIITGSITVINPLIRPLSRVGHVILGVKVDLQSSCKYPGHPSCRVASPRPGSCPFSIKLLDLNLRPIYTMEAKALERGDSMIYSGPASFLGLGGWRIAMF